MNLVSGSMNFICVQRVVINCRILCICDILFIMAIQLKNAKFNSKFKSEYLETSFQQRLLIRASHLPVLQLPTYESVLRHETRRDSLATLSGRAFRPRARVQRVHSRIPGSMTNPQSVRMSVKIKF